MKNMLIFGAAALLAGCACGKCKQEVSDVEQPIVVEVLSSMPCSVSCEKQEGCQSQPVVLKPRVTEVVREEIKRPCCDDDPNFVYLGDPKTIIPDAPEIYVISANRTINSMLAEAEEFYKKAGKMTVFIDKADAKSKDLPGGIDKGTDVIKKRFAQIENVKIVNKKAQADYLVNGAADWYDTATKTVPAIKYDLFLKGKDGHLIGEWSEIIHQAEGDRSWW